MDTLQKEERWQRDRDLFVERAKELDAEVLVEAAERDDAKQLQQAESLLERGVQALVVVPHNAEAAGKIVEAAKKRSVPVISYDRLILKADVDLYLSYDNRRVGEQQAHACGDTAPVNRKLQRVREAPRGINPVARCQRIGSLIEHEDGDGTAERTQSFAIGDPATRQCLQQCNSILEDGTDRHGTHCRTRSMVLAIDAPPVDRCG
jgi:ABC-type sugar transport system substrate-binding protein